MGMNYGLFDLCLFLYIFGLISMIRRIFFDSVMMLAARQNIPSPPSVFCNHKVEQLFADVFQTTDFLISNTPIKNNI